MRHRRRLIRTKLAWMLSSFVIGGMGGRAVGEEVSDLREVTIETSGLTMRLPTSWRNTPDGSADGLFVDPLKPYWRFWISSQGPRRLSTEESKESIQRLVSASLKNHPASKSMSIEPITDDRAIVQYQLSYPDVAPTIHWWIFDRVDGLVRTSIFTLSVYPNHVHSAETEDLKSLLRREISRARYARPAVLSEIEIRPESPESSSASSTHRSIAKLLSLHLGPELSDEARKVVCQDVLTTATALYEGVRGALLATGTGPTRMDALMFSESLYAAWLHGTRLGLDGIQPFERRLLEACGSHARNLQWDPAIDWNDFASRYEERRHSDLESVQGWLMAYFNATAIPEPDSYGRLMETEVQVLRRLGVDTSVGRNAANSERNAWVSAFQVVHLEMEQSAVRLSEILAGAGD